MSAYYLVFDVNLNIPIALAKTDNGRVTILAGEAMAECTFDKGEPRLDYARYWFPLFLSSYSWHPAIGEYIDKLGQRRIAEHLGVSKAFVQRLDSSDPPTL